MGAIVNVEDFRRRAHRYLPKAVFEYVDGGAEDESTVRANRDGFASLTFRPQVLMDVASRDQSTTILGQPLSSPLILAPAGLAGLVAPHGDLAAIRAAGRKGVLFCLSTSSTCTIEEAAAAATGPLWFQLYVWRDRGITASLVERARASGYHALCLTVDVPLVGQRERDIYNGFTTKPRVGPDNVLDTLRHVRWLRDIASTRLVTFKNFVGTTGGPGRNPIALGAFINSQADPSITWDDVEWLRGLWKGPLVVKGIMSASDARRAMDRGVDAIVVSNHGGRQLDGQAATIRVLPEVVAAVDGRAEVILDGGIRRGTDVVKALALGAKACMFGRPYLWALASGGQAGVERLLDLLHAEIDRTLALVGCPRAADLSADFVRGDGLGWSAG